MLLLIWDVLLLVQASSQVVAYVVDDVVGNSDWNCGAAPLESVIDDVIRCLNGDVQLGVEGCFGEGNLAEVLDRVQDSVAVCCRTKFRRRGAS